MTAPDKRYRRNFFIALVLHVIVIAVLIGWEQFLSDASETRPSSEIIEADILGELPVGTGTGRGEYKAPEPAGNPPPAPVPKAEPSQNLAGDEVAAPAPKPVAPPKADPGDIAIPKKNTPTKPVAALKPPSVPTGKKSTTNTTTKVASTTGTGKGSSAEEIKNRFANALKSSPNGTPYGDGKLAGGGTGKSGKIGSPNGREDGVVGGIGQGTPYASYYTHIHDVLYEAWEQPGTALAKQLMTTVALRIARDGSVIEATVKVGSGNKLMDDSVLAAVRKVPRLEPPPDALMRGASVVIAVNFQVEG
ncbi:MAG: TonB family protein [Verrucomicrobiota bacterium]